MAFSCASRVLRSLEQPEAYLRDLEAAFRQASSGQPIPVAFPIELLVACKA